MDLDKDLLADGCELKTDFVARSDVLITETSSLRLSALERAEHKLESTLRHTNIALVFASPNEANRLNNCLTEKYFAVIELQSSRTKIEAESTPEKNIIRGL